MTSSEVLPPETIVPLAESAPAGDRRILAGMVLVALAFRVALIFFTHSYQYREPSLPDTAPQLKHFVFGLETGSIAGAIARGEGFSSPFEIPTGPTAWIAPIYPFMCAGVFRIFGVFTDASAFVILLLNSIFSALTCIPLFLIAERVFDRRVALWSAWIWAVVPFFMKWPTTWIWDMSLSALLLALIVLMSLRLADDNSCQQWLGFGVLWGCAALTNPALLSFLPFSGLWPAYHLWRKKRAFLLPVIVSAVAFWLMITPWLARNYTVFHEFVFIRGNFGFEFRLGNYPGSNGMGWVGLHPTYNKIQLEKFQRSGERGFVEASKREALTFVRRNPREFAQLTLSRFLSFWDGSFFDYQPRVFRPWVYASLSLLAWAGVLLALYRRHPAAWLFATLFFFYPAVYYITYPQARYRHAIEPELLILSVYLIFANLQHVRARLSG